MRNARPTALALAIALAAGAAGAGTELATQTLRADGEVQKGLAYLDGKRLRIDARDGRRAVVYRADRGVLWVIDHKKKSYLEVEQPTADALAASSG